jgi:hypothetical protein
MIKTASPQARDTKASHAPIFRAASSRNQKRPDGWPAQPTRHTACRLEKNLIFAV